MSATPLEAAKPSRRGIRKFLRPCLFALVFLTLVASVFCNVVLYKQADLNYRRLSEAELDPYGLMHANFPPDLPATNAGQSLPAMIFFGDSRARGWPAPNVSGFRFVNRGIVNQTTAQVLGRFEVNVTPASPRVVVLQAGINDLKAIALLPSRRNEIVAECKGNLRLIVSRARDHGATVIVTTIFPPGNVPLQRRMVWSPEFEKAVEEVNADLRTLASDRVIILDAWKLLEDQGRLREGYGIDTLHLNSKGYETLNAELEKILHALPAETGAGRSSN